MATTPSSFGTMLRRRRLAATLTQEELADRAGVSSRGISDLERGVRQWPRPETARLLADVLAPEDPERTAFLAAALDPHALSANRGSSSSSWPTFAGEFFGREADIAAVTDLLVHGASHLITITGTGGTGKTRLATEVAGRMRDHFRDGVVFVDLTPITDAQLVLPTMARVLTGDETVGGGGHDSLVAALRKNHRLVILDNCEQVLDVGVWLSQLLDACPDVTILATSRAHFGLREEREWLLAPLPLPDVGGQADLRALGALPAVALFAARATSATSSFQLTEANVDAVIAICRDVDGLPLAIELAAARCKHLAVTELAPRLQRRLPLLTGGPRNAPARQQTLRATIAWSYDLLAADEQAVLRQLSIFAGGWTLEAAEAVIALREGATVLDVLSALHDQHLITVNTHGFPTRFGMLETIREFARDLLARTDGAEAVENRHAAYFLDLAHYGVSVFETAFPRHWLERIDQEQPNLRQTFDYLERTGDHERFAKLAVALWVYWYMRSNAVEGLPRLRTVLARETTSTLLRGQALLGAGAIGYTMGSYADAVPWLREAEGIARSCDHASTLVGAVMMQGAIAEHLGHEDTAVAKYLESLRIALETGQRWNLSYVYPNLSDAAYRRGELDLAEHYAHEAVAPLQETNNQYMECMNFGCLAQVWLARNDVRAAAQAFQEALMLAIAIDSQWNIANAIAGAAAVAAASRRYDEAAHLLGAAEAACEATGHPKLPHFYLFTQTTARVARELGPEVFRMLQARGRSWEALLARERANALLIAAQDATIRQVRSD